MTVVSLDFKAPPTVADFLACNERVRLIQGPIGSGKSSGCNFEILRRASEQKPGPDKKRRTRFVVIRNTYRELEDTTRKTFESWMEPLIAAGMLLWRESDFACDIRFADVECEVMFRALDKAEHVKKLLSLEITGAYMNEAREVPQAILAGLKGRIGRFPAMKDGGPSWWGIWMDTNPMPMGHWLYKLFKTERPDGHAFFEQPSGLSPNAENVENLPPGYYLDSCQGQDEEWVDEYIRGKNPKRDKGSIYGDLISRLEEIGGVGKNFEHPRDGIFATFDLGISDSTAIWWWRANGHGVDFLDYYEASGKPLSHFFEQLERRETEYGWQYRRLVLPHDARARTLQTGASVLDQFLEKYPNQTDILPALSVEDGISATRYLLERVCRFHPRTMMRVPERAWCGVDVLRGYRYQWDADLLTYSRKPLHDWTSHGADAARYVALYAKRAAILTKPAPPPAKHKGIPLHNSVSLEELWASNEASE